MAASVDAELTAGSGGEYNDEMESADACCGVVSTDVTALGEVPLAP